MCQKTKTAETCTKDGESPVKKTYLNFCIPSSLRHVKSLVNPRGPPRKTKYS